MNANIKNLLDKYYNGETSLEEEEVLKNSLFLEETNQNEDYSRLIFKTFLEEREETVPSFIKILPKMSHYRGNFYKKWIYAAAGIAACFVLVCSLFLHHNNQNYDAYVIINGVRINDEKLALQYINESFAESERINNFGLTQLYEMQKIENEMNAIANNIFNH
jgi:cell division protein FtsL